MQVNSTFTRIKVRTPVALLAIIRRAVILSRVPDKPPVRL